MKRFAGIDIGSERHVVAVVDEHLAVLVKATPFGEEAAGYQRLVELLGSPQDCLVAMELPDTIGATFLPTWLAQASRSHYSIRYAPGVSPRRNWSAPRPMRLMPSVSLGSRRRKILLPASWPRRDSTNCVK